MGSRPPASSRERILATAARLFVERGYHGFSMREVAEGVGVTKPALYYHFPDKESLVLAVLLEGVEALEALLTEAAGAPDLRTRLRTFIAGLLALPPERRALMRIARQEIVHLSPGARARFNRRYREAFLARVEALLQEGIRRGELRPAPLSWLARALLGMLYPFLYREDGGDDPEALADFLTDLFLEGARPPGIGRR